MFLIGNLDRIKWDDFYRFFMEGNPPVILLLLGLNAFFLVLYIRRKMTEKRKMHPKTVLTTQLLVIGCNFAVAFSPSFLSGVRLPI
jgi:hypothetical protein